MSTAIPWRCLNYIFSPSDWQGIRPSHMTLRIMYGLLSFSIYYQCPLPWWPWCHPLKVNSIRSSPCHGQCQLGQEHSDFVIFGTQGVRKLPKKLEEHKYVGVLWSEMIEIPSVLLAADFLQYPPPKISGQEFAWRLFCSKTCQSFTSFRIGYISFDLHHKILATSWYLRIDDKRKICEKRGVLPKLVAKK